MKTISIVFNIFIAIFFFLCYNSPVKTTATIYEDKNMDRLFCKGYTWGAFSRSGMYQTEDARRSMERLHSNGLDWICIPVNAYQETYMSTLPCSVYGRTQTDEDVIYAIGYAKKLGMKVCLKPMVDCFDGVWRARIHFPEEGRADYNDRWFANYTAFMLHYAEIAEKTGCEMLCTGCEMDGMDVNTERCIKLIGQVREVYHGLIMHNINHGDELKYKWLDKVDIIGISAYYRLTDGVDVSIDRMLESWAKVKERVKAAHEHYGRPVMFAEIGIRNEHGCSQYPYDFKDRYDVALDEDEQADFYESAMRTFWDEEWFGGFFWWDWKARLTPDGKIHENRDFTVYGKKAESVLRKWYTEK